MLALCYGVFTRVGHKMAKRACGWAIHLGAWARCRGVIEDLKIVA